MGYAECFIKRKLETQTAPASAGLWRLAMRRLWADKIAMASLIVVLFYLIVLILSLTGVIASDWNKEVAVSYAPPTFIGADKTTEALKSTAAVDEELPENPVDPLKDVIHQLKAEIKQEKSSGSAIDYYGVVDPLADDMKAIDQQLGGHLLDQQSELKVP